MLKKGEVVDVVLARQRLPRALREAGYLQPLQMDLLPNFANVTDQMLAKPNFDSGDGGKYSVPYMFGTTGFAVRLDEVTNVRESWDMLWDDVQGRHRDDRRLRRVRRRWRSSIGARRPTALVTGRHRDGHAALIEQKPLSRHTRR